VTLAVPEPVPTADSPRPYGNEEPPDTWWRRHFLAICLGTFCTAAAVLVVQQVGFKGLIGFSPQSVIPPSVIAADNRASAQFTPIVDHIYAVTNEALQKRDASLLSQVYVPTCQCYAQAETEINQLLSSHEVLGGDGTQVMSVQVYVVKPGAIVLGVTDKIDPYPIYNEQGQLLPNQGPGRIPTLFTMDLQLDGGVWKVSDVVLTDNTLP
jgi:hypothetical protein